MRTSRIWVGILALVLLACDHGVVPPELKELGSLQSVTYTARHLYPADNVALELIWPRLGTPALVLPNQDVLTVSYYAASTSDPSPISVTVGAPDSSDAPMDLPVLTPPDCDPDGICTVDVALPADLLQSRVLELCLSQGAYTRCHPGSLKRFELMPDPLRLAVITDLHLAADHLDRDAQRLRKLLAALEGADPPLDLIAVLGDTTAEGALPEHQGFLEVARTATIPLLTLPGNHEFKEGHIDHFLGHVNPHLDHATQLGPYLLVALNSGPGLFDETGRGVNAQSAGPEAAQVDWLRAITAPTDILPLVLVHHPPWSTGWFVMGRNRKSFLDACRQGDVRLILSGHTHRNEVYDHAGIGQGLSTRCETNVPQSRQPVTVVSAPSTEPHHAGYRLVELHADGDVSYCWNGVAVK